MDGLLGDVAVAVRVKVAKWRLSGVGSRKGAEQIFLLDSSMEVIVFQHKALL